MKPTFGKMGNLRKAQAMQQVARSQGYPWEGSTAKLKTTRVPLKRARDPIALAILYWESGWLSSRDLELSYGFFQPELGNSNESHNMRLDGSHSNSLDDLIYF